MQSVETTKGHPREKTSIYGVFLCLGRPWRRSCISWERQLACADPALECIKSTLGCVRVAVFLPFLAKTHAQIDKSLVPVLSGQIRRDCLSKSLEVKTRHGFGIIWYDCTEYRVWND